jgi:hypothetical protein
MKQILSKIKTATTLDKKTVFKKNRKKKIYSSEFHRKKKGNESDIFLVKDVEEDRKKCVSVLELVNEYEKKKSYSNPFSLSNSQYVCTPFNLPSQFIRVHVPYFSSYTWCMEDVEISFEQGRSVGVSSIYEYELLERYDNESGEYNNEKIFGGLKRIKKGQSEAVWKIAEEEMRRKTYWDCIESLIGRRDNGNKELLESHIDDEKVTYCNMQMDFHPFEVFNNCLLKMKFSTKELVGEAVFFFFVFKVF